MTTQPEALRMADALDELDATFSRNGLCGDAAAELRRLSAVNQELGAALRRLVSYCNTLEKRLMEADGEHPALQEAKQAYAKVEDV
jgi:hypothetical protein